MVHLVHISVCTSLQGPCARTPLRFLSDFDCIGTRCLLMYTYNNSATYLLVGGLTLMHIWGTLYRKWKKRIRFFLFFSRIGAGISKLGKCACFIHFLHNVSYGNVISSEIARKTLYKLNFFFFNTDPKICVVLRYFSKIGSRWFLLRSIELPLSKM